MATFTPIRSAGAEEEDKGILGSIISSVAKDITGAAKVGAATFFSPFDILGAEVPVSFDDVGVRDWTGAAAVASMFVGGIAATGIKGALAGQGARALVRGSGGEAARAAATAWGVRAGAVKNAVVTASAEAGAGVFFGAVRPLESAESRLGAVLGDAALFGGFGGGLSFVGSGIRATVGSGYARLKGTTRSQLVQQAAQTREATQKLSEYAGIRLRNPETNATRSIVRLSDGSVQVSEAGKLQEYGDFNLALSESFALGYGEREGLARSTLRGTKIRAGLPQHVLDALGAADGDLTKVIDAEHFKNYRATREAAARFHEEGATYNWLAAENSVPFVDGGLTRLEDKAGFQSFRRDVLRIVPKNVAKKMEKLEDPSEFMRQAALEGALDPENLLTGKEIHDFVEELFINDMVPEGSGFRARNPFDATLLAKVTTPQTLAKIHPEIMPLVDLGDVASTQYKLGATRAKQFMFELENKVSRDVATMGADIIDASAEAGGVRASRLRALELARATNNPALIEFVEKTTDKLNVSRLRLVGAGRLGASDADEGLVAEARRIISDAIEAAPSSEAAEDLALSSAPEGVREVVSELLNDAGLAGYFPIVHTGQVRVDINGEVSPAFFDSWREAERFLVNEGKGRGGYISNAFAADDMIAKTVTPKEFGRLTQIIRDVDGLEISSSQAAEMLKDSGILPSRGPRKYSGNLQRRRLGVRDFATDPLQGLDLYLTNVERTLAFNTFEREANAIIENLPAAKTALKAWAETQKDLLLGRPTATEKNIAALFSSVAPEVTYAKLRRYSGMLRWGQGIMKLGGVWSGAVNATQFAMNTVPMLGPRWAAEGLNAYFRPAVRKEANALLMKHGVDLGVHTSLDIGGSLVGNETIVGEIRAAVARAKIGEGAKATKAAMTALENTWMFAFNSAERMNRYGTFWGAYKKGVSENLSEEAAVAYARKVVNRTQFDYSVANLPQLLQGPVAGVLGQFKTYFINEVELIASLDRKTQVKMMLMFQALGGAGSILALPGVEWADAASRHFFDVKASEAIKLEGGRDDSGAIGRFAAFGLPGLANIDLTNYIGPGGFSQMMMGLMGPTISDAGAWTRFLGQAVKDVKTTGYLQPPTVNAWLQQVMPAQIRRFTRGAAIYETGEARNPYSGKLVYRPDDRLKAAVAEGIGIPQVRMSMERIQDDILTRETESYRNARESYRRQIALANLNGQPGDVQELLNRASSSGFVFAPRDIRSAVNAFSLTGGERRERRTPKAMRTEFEDFYGI